MRMNLRFSLLLCLLAPILPGMVGCTMPVPSPGIEIKRLVFLNQTSRPLSEVKVFVQKTRESVLCGTILPNTECSMGFPVRQYQGNRFDVSWIENERPVIIKDIQALPGENLVPGKPVHAVLVFGEHGQFSATLPH